MRVFRRDAAISDPSLWVMGRYGIKNTTEIVRPNLREQRMNIRLLLRVSLLCCVTLSFGAASSSGPVPTHSIFFKGQLGSGPSEVGEVITDDNNYDGLPDAIAVDSKNNIYIADNVNDRIQAFDNQGAHVFSLNLRSGKDRHYLLVSDITTDDDNFLYVPKFSKSISAIDIFNHEGSLVKSIDLSAQKIRWDEQRGWIPGFIQVERILVDSKKNIYLQGFGELIKLGQDGGVRKKWVRVSGKDLVVISKSGDLYLLRTGHTLGHNIEQCDPAGNLVRSASCEAMGFAQRSDGSGCAFARFIDESGNRYWFENNDKIIVMADRTGRRITSINQGDFSFYGNTVKFGRKGDVFVFMGTKREFSIERIVWPSIGLSN